MYFSWVAYRNYFEFIIWQRLTCIHTWNRRKDLFTWYLIGLCSHSLIKSVSIICDILPVINILKVHLCRKDENKNVDEGYITLQTAYVYPLSNGLSTVYSTINIILTVQSCSEICERVCSFKQSGIQIHSSKDLDFWSGNSKFMEKTTFHCKILSAFLNLPSAILYCSLEIYYKCFLPKT